MTSREALALVNNAQDLAVSNGATNEQLRASLNDLAAVLNQAVEMITVLQQENQDLTFVIQSLFGDGNPLNAVVDTDGVEVGETV